MDGIRNVLGIADQWFAYLDYCFNREPFSTVCGAFWERLILGVIGLGILALVIGLSKFLSYRRKHAAAMRAYEERNAIDAAAIRAHSWEGDKAYQTSLGDEEIQRRIREGIEQRRREVQS